jgi:hypothetical protein
MLAVTGLSVTLCIFLGSSAIKLPRSVTARLSELRELGISKDPTATFELLRRKYGSELHPVEGCTAQLCQYEISLSNATVAALRIVPYTEMNTQFTTYKGSLVYAMVEYRVALRDPHSPVVHIQQGTCAHGCGVRFDVNPHGTLQEMWNGLVMFDTRASSQQRDAALALNVGCVNRLGGCKDIVDLLPTMWMQSRPGGVSSRFVGLSQQLEESHGSLSPDDF